MGVQIVNSLAEMRTANKAFWNRVRISEDNILRRLSKINNDVSVKLAETVKFKGTLVSGIKIEKFGKISYRVISSAPHSFMIENGVPPKGDMMIGGKSYVSFESTPLLKSWVREKLMTKDKGKANYFLSVGGVLVGEKGFPFGHPKGLQFMKIGFDIAVQNSEAVVSEELLKLN
ncbi:MAG: hypothetical protein ACTSYA_12155 [Candidatus Kariarchaeaceae archaeon]